jgi:GTP cyclohydrolase I
MHDNEINHHFEQIDFDWDYKISKNDLPDPQCFHTNDVTGGEVIIQKVGITKLDFPINLKLRDGQHQVVHSKASAYVSLDDTQARGINMSRLAKWFYSQLDGRDGVGLLEMFDILDSYKRELPSDNAYLKVRFELPLQKKALREEHMNWIYYPVTLEIEDKDGKVKSYLSIDYTYSSACPCSKALAEYSTQELNTPSISHSQRSIANIKVEFDVNEAKNGNILWIEDIIDMARAAQPSELLPGVVSRVGEFSFAQLVAANGVTGFVEDVLRRFYAAYNADDRIKDFVVSVDHQESLNQNHANGVIYKGVEGGLR